VLSGLNNDVHHPVEELSAEVRKELTKRPRVGRVHMTTISSTMARTNQLAFALSSPARFCRRLGFSMISAGTLSGSATTVMPQLPVFSDCGY
jgi:hypothetical protein